MRDVIASHPAADRVPYDVNYVWRLGNEHFTHDELPESAATPDIANQIISYFDNTFSTGKPYLVEKTVSNCLRVPFVCKVFPKARFVHLVRDGRDVLESSYRQWIAGPDWRYVMRKAVQFPVLKAPAYAVSYARILMQKLTLRNQHVEHQRATWGPRYEGIDNDIKTKDLLEVCAIQWARSVDTAIDGLNQVAPEQVFTIRYEDFVESPLKSLAEIGKFIGLNPEPFQAIVRVQDISRQNLGKGLRNLNPEQVALVMPRIETTLRRLEYILK